MTYQFSSRFGVMVGLRLLSGIFFTTRPNPTALGHLTVIFGWSFLILCETSRSLAEFIPASPRAENVGATTTVRLGSIREENGASEDESIDLQPPPLSMLEAIGLLQHAVQLLRAATNGNREITTRTAQAVQQSIVLVQRYVDRVDKMHPTQPLYRWQRFLSSKVPRKEWGILEARLTPPRINITALALSVHNGDVDIARVVARANDGTRWEFNQPLQIVGNSPRDEIYFLPLATELATVQVTCRQHNPQEAASPRLFVEGGICTLPESGKQANYHLQLSRAEVVRRNTERAIAELTLTLNLLEEFRRTRRL